MQDHLATLGVINEAFGKGDIPAILDQMADDVRWEEWADNMDVQRLRQSRQAAALHRYGKAHCYCARLIRSFTLAGCAAALSFVPEFKA